ncbi:MAG TPA: glycosyltransferase family 4 protein [Anaerolineales bacterium]|jgi:glycosyltransferase involved in cell wall biosynthesis|nr:glycosyltransferase family 4 protein [Anaerolineales bacterium]
MKILLINQAFVSPDEPGHTRHFEMAKFLQSRGHELVIVASDLNYQTGQRTVERKGVFAEQVIGGARVFRAYIYPALHHSYFWRVISFFSFMFSSTWTAFQVKDIDLVLGTTPPIFQAVSAWFVAWIRRKPFLLEVRDLWPEFGVSMGVLKNPIMIALGRWLEKFLYRRATHILVNSPAYKDYMVGKGVRENKITFIPYGTDVDMFNPRVDGSSIRNELGLQDKFIVLYAGALGQANDIDTILRAAERLSHRVHRDSEKNLKNSVDSAAEKDRICFILFGDGKERPRLQVEAERMKLSNVIFAGVRPKKDMPQVVASADVCLAILQDIPMFRTTYPNKVFDYMAAGRATVLVIDGVSRKLIESSYGGVFVQPNDDETLADTILDLSKNMDIVKQMGQNAREYLVKHLDRRDKLNETLALLESLVKKN